MSYPKMLYKGDGQKFGQGTKQIVYSEAEESRVLAAWFPEPVEDEPVTVTVSDDPPAPKKRGRPKKAE